MDINIIIGVYIGGIIPQSSHGVMWYGPFFSLMPLWDCDCVSLPKNRPDQTIWIQQKLSSLLFSLLLSSSAKHSWFCLALILWLIQKLPRTELETKLWPLTHSHVGLSVGFRHFWLSETKLVCGQVRLTWLKVESWWVYDRIWVMGRCGFVIWWWD